MSKKIALVVGIVILGIVTATIFYFATQVKKDTTPKDSEAGNSRLSGVPQIQDLIYKDSSGFSFKYTSDFEIVDATPAEGDYYTLLEVKKSGGKLTFSVLDTTYMTVDDWLKKDRDAPKDASLIGEVNLGGIKAKQYSYYVDARAMFGTFAVDQDVLYRVDSFKDAGDWENLHSQVVTSFAFTPQVTSSGGNTIDEGEEIVE